MTGSSLDAAYFDGIFEGDDDPWDLANSPYEDAKFAHTCDALADRQYSNALEIGCAQGVLTKRLADLCDSLLAIDISAKAIELARKRIGERSNVNFEKMAFPLELPGPELFDLVTLSEVAYYWDIADLGRASEWLKDHVRSGGRIMLVHYIGETDYPHSADEAMAELSKGLKDNIVVELAERRDKYRLDLWEIR